MLVMHGELGMGNDGIERYDEYSAQDVSEHELALIENAYRDWVWLERGQLINFQGCLP